MKTKKMVLVLEYTDQPEFDAVLANFIMESIRKYDETCGMTFKVTLNDMPGPRGSKLRQLEHEQKEQA